MGSLKQINTTAVLFLLLSLLGVPHSRADTWTILVYWAVDNDLYDFSTPYLKAFEKVGSSTQLNIIAEIDYPGKPRLTERYLVLPDTGPVIRESSDLPHSLLLDQLPIENDSASPESLSNFTTWAHQRFPAGHVALVIGSHGMNWRGVIEDSTSGSVMKLSDFSKALEPLESQRKKPLDLLLFDACRMAFADTLLELKGRAQIMLGSQFDLNGFTHIPPLSLLRNDPTLSGADLARSYIDAYPHPDWQTPDLGSSMLKLDEAHASVLEGEIDELSNAILKLKKRAITKLKSGLRTTSNEYQDLAIDVGNLAKELESISPSPELLEIVRRYEGTEKRTDPLDHTTVQWAFPENSTVMAVSYTKGTGYSSGLSLNCPEKIKDYELGTLGSRHPLWVKACKHLF